MFVALNIKYTKQLYLIYICIIAIFFCKDCVCHYSTTHTQMHRYTQLEKKMLKSASGNKAKAESEKVRRHKVNVRLFLRKQILHGAILFVSLTLIAPKADHSPNGTLLLCIHIRAQKRRGTISIYIQTYHRIMNYVVELCIYTCRPGDVQYDKYNLNTYCHIARPKNGYI